MSSIRKTHRKGSRSAQSINRFKQTEQKMTLFEMFERFMVFKQTEGLAKATIRGYYEHLHYLNDYLGGDVPNDMVTVELFRNYIGYMLNDQGLKPTTVNVRIRTNRAFLRHAYQEGWIETPIHEKFKPIKTLRMKYRLSLQLRLKHYSIKLMIHVLSDFVIR